MEKTLRSRTWGISQPLGHALEWHCRAWSLHLSVPVLRWTGFYSSRCPFMWCVPHIIYVIVCFIFLVYSTGQLRGCRGVAVAWQLFFLCVCFFVVFYASVRIKVSFGWYHLPHSVLIYFTWVLLRCCLHLDLYSLLLLAKVKLTIIRDITSDSHPVLIEVEDVHANMVQRVMLGYWLGGNVACRFLECLPIISKMGWGKGERGSDIGMER